MFPGGCGGSLETRIEMTQVTEAPATSYIENLSTSGIAAQIPRGEQQPVLVAPTQEEQFNRVRLPLRPIACWSVGDARFELGSSFVRPEIGDDFSTLAALVARLELQNGVRPVATTFGHADPVGQDEFNKKLSGRRAAAVYAMLTRRTEIWEDIYQNKGEFTASLSADEWGKPALMGMLANLGFEGSIDDMKPVVEAFQTDAGLGVDGIAGPLTREQLFLQYMDKHARFRTGESFKFETNEFLGGGEDAAGAGDFQGCGEANPLRIFSKQEIEEFSKPDNHADRDAENAPNRRVVVYLFPPEVRVDKASWPCPRAKDGVGSCKKRFWSNAAERMENTLLRREFQETQNTFSCRFYERIARDSPCEITSIQGFVIHLLDADHQRLPHAAWRVLEEGEELARGIANEEAVAIVTLSHVPHDVTLEWRPADAVPEDEETYPFVRRHFPLAGTDPDENQLVQIMENLALARRGDLKLDVESVQAKFGHAITGLLDDVRELVQGWHDTGETPPLAPGAPPIDEPQEADEENNPEIQEVIQGHFDSAEDE